MAKVLKCREVGMDCDWEGRGETTQEVLAKAAEHARKDHGFDDIPAEVKEKVMASIHDEER